MTIYDYGRSPKYWMLAMDIASHEVKRCEPTELAVDVRCWMDANDFDVIFVANNVTSIVHRERLIDCSEKATVAEFVEDFPEERRQSVDMSLNDAFRELERRKWFALFDGGKLEGLVTRDDLAKPAAGAFVMAHLITMERILRRLLGTYTNQSVRDEPPSLDNPDEETYDGKIIYFSQVINEVAKVKPLLDELEYRKSDYNRVGSWAIEFRKNMAHSRRLDSDKTSMPSALERFFAVQELMFRALHIVEERPQIWRAIEDAVIVDSKSAAFYTGPNAVDLPCESPCYVITAANPFEQRMKDQVNAHRNKMLYQVLERRSNQIAEVVGRSPCGKWKEESFLVSGVTESSILGLAMQFGQRAVFKLTGEEKLVVATNGEVKSQTSRHK